jgi:hypothetical protein
MASNQVSNERRPRGGGPGPTRAGQSTPNYASEPYRDYGALGDAAHRATEYYEQGEDRLRECMSGREGTSLLLSLAAGVGVGLVLGIALGRSRRESMSWRDRVAAEGFGRRLMDRLEGLIPDTIAEHFAK